MLATKELKIIRTPELEERFMKYVVKGENENDCWTWIGAVMTSSTNGKMKYGGFSYHSRPIRAHRMSYAMFNGPIPKNMCVLHVCDNPKCVNPNHLHLGTPKDNLDDCISKGRFPYGQDCYKAKLDNDKVKIIKSLLGKVHQRVIAKMFGVSQPTISRIAVGFIWSHVN